MYNPTKGSMLLISCEFRIKPLLGALELISIVIVVISIILVVRQAFVIFLFQFT